MIWVRVWVCWVWVYGVGVCVPRELVCGGLGGRRLRDGQLSLAFLGELPGQHLVEAILAVTAQRSTVKKNLEGGT